MPVDDVERAVWSEFQIYRPEVGIFGINEVVPDLTGEATVLIFPYLVLLGAEETDGVVYEKVSLVFFRKMA